MIDLHTHSTASDGTCTPSQLIELATALNLDAIALTDHDTTTGVEEFVAAAVDSPVIALPGVEISCAWYGGSIHILGLDIDPNQAALVNFLANATVHRDERNRNLVDHLARRGISITLDDAKAEAYGGMLGRPHFARALVRMGVCDSIRSAFAAYLGDRHMNGVRYWRPKPEQAIQVIHDAGGVAVWAHPTGPARHPTSRLRKIGKQLAAAGLDGIEGYHSSYSTDQIQQVNQLANELGLAVSGGSDFHGDNSPGVTLGHGKGNLNIPAKLLEPLLARRKSIHGTETSSAP